MHNTSFPLQLVVMDLAGPVRPSTLGGKAYIQNLFDVFTSRSMTKIKLHRLVFYRNLGRVESTYLDVDNTHWNNVYMRIYEYAMTEREWFIENIKSTAESTEC